MNSLSSNAASTAQVNAVIASEKQRLLMLWVLLQTLLVMQGGLWLLALKSQSHRALAVATVPATTTLEIAGAICAVVLLGAAFLVWESAREGVKSLLPLPFMTRIALGLIWVRILNFGGLLLALNSHDIRYFAFSIILVWLFDLLVVLPRCRVFWRSLKSLQP